MVTIIIILYSTIVLGWHDWFTFLVFDVMELSYNIIIVHEMIIENKKYWCGHCMFSNNHSVF